jgi:CheY-like chemotaxis protein
MTSDISLAGRRILVVEDDHDVATSVVLVLELLGAQIRGPAATAADALALIAGGEPIDGAVLDVCLRGEMVYPVADALQRRGVPIVFTTGYGKELIAPEYAHVPCLEKPVDPEQLARVLFA